MTMEKIWASCCLLAFAILASQSHAQDTSCLNQLVPCLVYLNSTATPPSSCCDPLKSVIKSDPQCLCAMLSSDSAGQTGINRTAAIQIPAKCGVNVNAASCSANSPTNKSEVPNSASRFSCNAMLIALLSLIIQISWASNSIFSTII